MKLLNTAETLPKSVDPQLWVEEYHDLLFRYALARFRDADLAEEKTQETFLAALKLRDKFQGLASERTWLVSILKRRICDHFRRISRDKQFTETVSRDCLWYHASESGGMHAETSRTWISDPSMAYEQKEFLMIIKHALSELPGRLAQAFILREVIELTSQEVCECMGISVGNLHVMLHRARKHLRQEMRLRWVLEQP
jgi:RNA polymerase sigma-70 factor (TIGR02943 family)